jgi:hypothetical protein
MPQHPRGAAFRHFSASGIALASGHAECMFGPMHACTEAVCVRTHPGESDHGHVNSTPVAFAHFGFLLAHRRLGHFPEQRAEYEELQHPAGQRLGKSPELLRPCPTRSGGNESAVASGRIVQKSEYAGASSRGDHPSGPSRGSFVTPRIQLSTSHVQTLSDARQSCQVSPDRSDATPSRVRNSSRA